MHQREAVAAPGTVCQNQDDPLQSTLELQLLEHDERHTGESAAEPAPDGLGIVDCQQLSREDHRQPAARA